MANYEQLFLLEVLVDKVRLLTKALEAFTPECEDEPETPVRIRVKFSDFPCFEITQDLAPPSKEKKDSDPLTTAVVFSSGKSCMFPMDPEQLVQDLIKYPMAVTVFKKDADSPLPEIIGQTKVPLGDYMSNIIKRAAEWALEEPLSEMIQDTFPLRNMQDQDVGTITMLVRLTCFGKTIITKFQIADNKKSFLFKNAKTQDYEFKCKKCMPGQPIHRPRTFRGSEEDGEGDEGEEGEGASDWMADGGYGAGANQIMPCVDKAQMTETYQDPCAAEKATGREAYTQGPGFQRQEGPGFTASMEVGYPDDGHDNYGSSYGNGNAGPLESQSSPTVKKEPTAKSKARGKSADPKKVDIGNGVKLTTNKRKKKTKFHVPQGIAYPGVILGHKYCVAQGPPVPAKNGWAWKTTVPVGMKWEDVRGRRPGAYLKQTWATLKAVEELKRMGKRKKVKRKPPVPDTRKTTVHIHRIKGIYHVTMNPVKGPDDKEDPEPVVYTLERPEDGSDASEIELDLTVPDPPYPPPPSLKHQAQQFCEEDLPLILPKQVFIKKKKKKKEKPRLYTSSKKKKPGSAKSMASTKSGKDQKVTKAPPAKGAPKGKEWGKGKGDQKKEATGKGTSAKLGAGGKGPGGKATGKDAGSAKGVPAAKGAPPAKVGPTKVIESAPVKAKKKGKKKGDDEDDVYPWDEWIMKLNCKNKQSPED